MGGPLYTGAELRSPVWYCDKREGRNEIFEQETMEELEDEEGNVYNRKTYEDLKKQGLI